MTQSANLLRALAALTLLTLPLKILAEDVDCRNCHGVTKSASAVDLNKIYENPAAHHPVGKGFPLMDDSFHRPTAQLGDIAFFDRNDNGQPELDEIQLFGSGAAAVMTCSTCHVEHGTTHALQRKQPMYLRITNINSALCSTCHNQ